MRVFPKQICIQSERNTQLKEAVQQSTAQLERMRDRQQQLKEKHDQVVAMLESQNIDLSIIQVLSRRGTKEVNDQESQNASLSRTIEALNLKRDNMRRDFERQAHELRAHLAALAKTASTLSQKNIALKMHASGLGHQLHERKHKLPEAHQPDPRPPPVSYQHVQPRVYGNLPGNYTLHLSAAKVCPYRTNKALCCPCSRSHNSILILVIPSIQKCPEELAWPSVRFDHQKALCRITRRVPRRALWSMFDCFSGVVFRQVVNHSRLCPSRLHLDSVRMVLTLPRR